MEAKESYWQVMAVIGIPFHAVVTYGMAHAPAETPVGVIDVVVSTIEYDGETYRVMNEANDGTAMRMSDGAVVRLRFLKPGESL